MTEAERRRWSKPHAGEALWMEDMLAYCTHLLTQIRDLPAGAFKDDGHGFVDFPAITGPEDDPDEYDVDGLLAEIRRRRPLY